jgi:hypothetical protein
VRPLAKLALACCLGIISGLVPAATTSRATAQVAMQPATSSVTATAATPTSMRVSWTSPADSHRWWVIVTGPLDRSVAQRTACGACRSIVVEHLAPGSGYYVRVVAVDANGAFGAFSTWITATTPPVAGCAGTASTAVCAHVDARTAVDSAVGTGAGSLHGVTAETAPDLVRALEPTAWRVSASDVERIRLARSYGGSVTVILSDPWMVNTGNRAPWTDWAFYEWWVGAVVDAHIANDLVPDYWDVQNEPSAEVLLGGAPATEELLFEQYRRAAAVIHQRLPHARVIGPTSAYIRFGSGLSDVDDFLDRSVAAGVPIGGLAWHEIGGGCLGYCDGSPRAVLQHADDARASLAARGLDDVPLHVNEWGAPWNHQQPGAAVGYLSSLAHADIDVANPTCWVTESADSCFARPGMLGGRLLADGRTPTDVWFAHRAYAEMTGPGHALLDSSIADPDASVVATRDVTGTIRVLVGRHTGCHTGLDDNCPGFAYQPDTTVRAVVTVPGTMDASASYVVTVDRIPSTSGALAGPTRLAQRTVTASNGRIDAGQFVLRDGAALSVTLVPTPTTTTTTTTTTAPPATTTSTTSTTTQPTVTTTTAAPTTTSTTRPATTTPPRRRGRG